MTVYLTGYTYWDNDPPGSAEIAYPSPGRTEASGTGTYDDPISLAVGLGGWEAGTLAYLPGLQRFVRVDDRCGSCAQGYRGLTWVDIWLGGQDATAQAADQCARALTGVVEAILDPPADLPVRAGVISDGSGCHR